MLLLRTTDIFLVLNTTKNFKNVTHLFILSHVILIIISYAIKTYFNDHLKKFFEY